MCLISAAPPGRPRGTWQQEHPAATFHLVSRFPLNSMGLLVCLPVGQHATLLLGQRGVGLEEHGSGDFEPFDAAELGVFVLDIDQHAGIDFL